MSKKVVVYSQPGCVSCGKAKEFLSQNKIEYTERNVAADKTALAELEKLGYKTTPVIVVDGEVVAGFDRAKLENLLLRS
jgi:glutaredoxin 3